MFKKRGIITFKELNKLVDAGVVEDVGLGNVNVASIDVRLADTIYVERLPEPGQVAKAVDVSKGESLPMVERRIQDYGAKDKDGSYYDLMPGEFILAATIEKFNMPMDISAEYMLKSTLARNGLEHLAARWCDAGWHGSNLTLELVNVSRYHPIRLRVDMGIGQMVFHRHAKEKWSTGYGCRGQYNEDNGATPGKVLR